MVRSIDQKWNIGSVVLPGRMLLAPMAGITDQAMRLICAQMGCHFSYTEMVSAKGYLMSAKSAELLQIHPEEPPLAIKDCHCIIFAFHFK